MTKTIALTTETIYRLDLSPIAAWAKSVEAGDFKPEDFESAIAFQIDFEREPTDPRELSEIPEVRLWFVRMEAAYPWMPLFLDWKSELARYVAMLVPHEFHPTEGIQFNPESLEIFLMRKVFELSGWLKARELPHQARAMAFAKMLGYDLEAGFFELIG
ncbi:MAG: CRR6 family NdhI maturation factor [Geitlerinemataceae cyanobacterium]